MTTELVKKEIPEIMEWIVDSGEQLQFTIDDAKNISGNPNVTAKEFYLFCQICKANKLNPFLKDAYLIKYGNNQAQIITGKNSAIKIASRHKSYNGYKAGIIVIDQNKKVIKREGSMVYGGETLVGGWGKVFRKDWEQPAYDEVSLKEYIGKKKDGTVNSQWATKPATMIRKVGLVHPLREAFPEEFNNIYDESEISAIENSQKGENLSTKQKVAKIFNKQDEDIIEGEAIEVTEEKPDVLTNELKIYVKALEVNTKSWLEKAHCDSIEQLPPDIKQKCIDNLKPKYEALKQEPDKTEKAIQETFDLAPEDDPFSKEYVNKEVSDEEK